MSIAWDELAREARSLTESEPDEVANMANVAALLHGALNAARGGCVNWTGFYRVAGPETLVLGPFQGRVACIRIPFGSGVCGAAAARREAVVVPDVEQFPGHIACDCA
jgi:GAF domain-containing protein